MRRRRITRARAMAGSIALAVIFLRLTHGGSAATLMSFQETVLTIPGFPGLPRDAVVADVDGKNGPDIVVLDVRGNLAVLLNQGDGSFGAPLYASSYCTANSLAVGQFNADSHPDIVVACVDAVNNGFRRLLGAGDGTFGEPQSLAPVEPYLGGGGDIDKLTIGEFGGEGQSLVYHQYFGGGQGVNLLCYIRVSELVADLDNFGTFLPKCSRNFDPVGNLLDMITIEAGGFFKLTNANPPLFVPDQNAFVFLENGNLGAISASSAPPYTGGFTVEQYIPAHALPPSPATAAPVVAAAGDLDNDGVVDIVALTGTKEFAVYHIDPSQPGNEPGFRVIADPDIVPTASLLGYPSAAAIADFDGDGNPDVAILSDLGDGESGTIEIHPGTGHGAFGQTLFFPTNSGTGRLIVADLNGDGRPDIVNLNRDSDVVTVQLNTTPGQSNHPPTCADGAASVFSGSALNGTVACSDPDAFDTTAVSLITGPTHGSLLLNANGTFTYLPTAGFSGADGFTFEATDSHGVDSTSATESITVYNTALGTNVVVQPDPDVRVTFAGVSVLGVTTAIPSAVGPALPTGFEAAGRYWEISTTATFGTPVEVCVAAPGVPAPRLFHGVAGSFVDVTTRVDGSFVCGTVATLSPFVVGRPRGAGTAPVLTLPGEVIRDATSPAGATVTYLVGVHDDTDPSPQLRCTPASGTLFSIGTTDVTCTATNAGGSSTSGTFDVRILGAAEQIARLIAKTRAYLGVHPRRTALIDLLEDAAEALRAHRRRLACRLLALYADEVRLTPARYLTGGHKTELIADANRIRVVIGIEGK